MSWLVKNALVPILQMGTSALMIIPAPQGWRGGSHVLGYFSLALPPLLRTGSVGSKACSFKPDLPYV